jgi:hypothetical protein
MVAMVLAALTAGTLTACSQSAQARTCDRMDGVSSAIEDLRNVTISENGTAALKEGLVTVQNQLALLRADLSQSLQPQVDAVKTSVQQLQIAVEDARQNPSATALAAVRNNLQATRATIGNLRTVVAATC